MTGGFHIHERYTHVFYKSKGQQGNFSTLATPAPCSSFVHPITHFQNSNVAETRDRPKNTLKQCLEKTSGFWIFLQRGNTKLAQEVHQQKGHTILLKKSNLRG